MAEKLNAPRQLPTNQNISRFYPRNKSAGVDYFVCGAASNAGDKIKSTSGHVT
jgi:hypothetical protein